MNWTINDIKNSKVSELNKHVTNEPQTSQKSKFGSQRVNSEDGKFDSRKEAKRYKQLKQDLKAGRIGFLARQVEYELNVNGTHSLVYKADFVYVDSLTGKTTVEDTKGFETREFRKKEKLMKKVHGITILKT